MRFVDEFRDREMALRLAERIARLARQDWTIMEVCGGQTHSIVRYGLDQLLPKGIHLAHGPGCPVCVTPLEKIEQALHLASCPEVILCSYGDMLRVPGKSRDLLSVKASGGDVRIVYSPLEALDIASRNPHREVVFFAVGFETTAPANGMAILQAHARGLRNFSALVSHVLVPPAMRAVLSSPGNRVQGFLAAGHVCTVMGLAEYEAIARDFRTPVVVAGFEPLDLLAAIAECIELLESGRAEAVNRYSRAVRHEGNPHARKVIEEVFEVADRKWRGIGMIQQSGCRLRNKYAAFDAEQRFSLGDFTEEEPSVCISGQVLQGLAAPQDCPAFGEACTPERPLGATMVSSEGACAAYYQYRRRLKA